MDQYLPLIVSNVSESLIHEMLYQYFNKNKFPFNSLVLE